jgi:hypothetical protein
MRVITFKADEETEMMLKELKKVYDAKKQMINKEYGFSAKTDTPISEVIRSAILWQYDKYTTEGYIKE